MKVIEWNHKHSMAGVPFFGGNMRVGQQLKEEGMQAVVVGKRLFCENAIHELRKYLLLLSVNKVEVFTFENFRHHYLRAGHEPPSHHNAWGALASRAAREGLIEWTGEYVPAVSRRTHGHPVKVWRSAS